MKKKKVKIDGTIKDEKKKKRGRTIGTLRGVETSKQNEHAGCRMSSTKNFLGFTYWYYTY